MRESMDTFVRNRGNALAVQAMEHLQDLQCPSKRLFIEGPSKAGKSALVRGWAEDASKKDAGDAVFACSGADIAMALQFEADDSFFDRLGAAPVLIIDDLEPLIRAERGDQLLSLMLAERERQNFSTVITSRKPLADYAFAEAGESMRSFRVIDIEPLDEEGMREFVCVVFAEYATDVSPVLDDGAAETIAAMMQGRFSDMENAARYLATDEDCAKLGALDAATVEELLRC